MKRKFIKFENTNNLIWESELSECTLLLYTRKGPKGLITEKTLLNNTEANNYLTRRIKQKI